MRNGAMWQTAPRTPGIWVRPSLVVALLVTALSSVGCFEVKQRLVLRDGAPGEFVTEIHLDLRAMAQMMVDMGEAADLELAQQDLREGFLADAGQIAEAPASMPPGVSWLGGTLDFEGDQVIMILRMGYEELVDLQQPMAMGAGLPQGAQMGDGEPILGPVTVTTKGRKVTFGGSPFGLLATKDEAEADAMKLMVEMLAGSKVVFELEAPDWKIKRSDAHEREGDVLRWTWDLAEAFENQEVSATFKR